jgi:hypothetical protein
MPRWPGKARGRPRPEVGPDEDDQARLGQARCSRPGQLMKVKKGVKDWRVSIGGSGEGGERLEREYRWEWTDWSWSQVQKRESIGSKTERTL